jgi:hypothetical protein
MGGRSGIDWEAIRIEYSTSPLSVEAIATKHGASKRQMLRRIKEGGWKRDLSNVIRVETEATLAELAAARKAEQTRAAEVATQAAIERATGKKAAMNLAEKADVTSTPNVTDVTSTKVPDGTTHVTKAPSRAEVLLQEGVRAAVEQKVGIITKHQVLAERFANLAMTLHNELEANSEQKERIDRLIVELGPEHADLAVDVAKATSFNARVAQLKALSEAAKNIITLERTSHGLDKEGEGGGVEDALDTLDRMRADLAKRNAPEGASSS